MKITDHVQENAFGYKVNYRMYVPENGSKNFMIFLHGIGERGAVDGSQLNLLEKNVGYPKFAGQGREFPFNIIAPQVPTGGSYSLYKKFLVPYVKLKYGAEKIIVTGLSMGGIATYEIVLMDDMGLIDAIAPICGRISASLAANYPELDVWAWHGDKDTTVPLKYDQYFVDAYNATHTKQIKLTVLPGVGHDAWTPAYNSPELYQWFLERFSDS
jgi:predicted peptidase